MKAGDKKAIYILFWVIMNVLIAIFISLVIELILQSYSCSMTEDRYTVYMVLGLIGAVTGLILAPIAWKKIYIDGLLGKKYVIKGGKQKLFM